MKKIILIMLALVLTAAIAGCGRKNEDTGSDSGSIPGTWQTASMSAEDDEKGYSEHYVQFTNSEIVYGHMKDGEFVADYSDEISFFEETQPGRYKVQAVASNGVQYTYQTSENSNLVLEYYETWQEDEYPEKYSGGASLIKCE